jgi:hypothetical protein
MSPDAGITGPAASCGRSGRGLRGRFIGDAIESVVGQFAPRTHVVQDDHPWRMQCDPPREQDPAPIGGVRQDSGMLLKTKIKKSVRNWALQRLFRPGDHLAIEFTRYAHNYPQHLWKTIPRGRDEVPGDRCLARVCGRSRGGYRIAPNDAERAPG